jgi:hypothetical protein
MQDGDARCKMKPHGDHCIIFVSCSIKIPKFKPKTITIRNIKNIDVKEQQNNAYLAPWLTFNLPNNFDEIVVALNNIILTLYDKHAPYEKICVTRKPAPWLSDDLRNMMRRRDCALRKYRKGKSHQNFESYRILRNTVK